MRAFTLVELLTVLAIVALVVAGGLTLGTQAREGTLRQQTRTQLSTLAAQLEAWKVKNGAYPADLSALNNDNNDAWGHPLAYAPAGDRFTLTSSGANLSDTNDDLAYDSTAN